MKIYQTKIRVNRIGQLSGSFGNGKESFYTLEHVHRMITGEAAGDTPMGGDYGLNYYTETYRKTDEGDSEARQEIKRNHLPSAEFNSVCYWSRRIENIQRTTGLIVVDIDGLDTLGQAASMRDYIFEDTRLGCVLAFVSVSGKGVKAVLNIGKDKVTVENIKDWYAAAAWYIRSTYGVEIDTNACDAVRLCFLSHDPDARLDKEGRESAIELQWAELWRDRNKKKAAQKPSREVVAVSDKDLTALQKLLVGFAGFCTKHGMCFLDNYNTWLGFGANCHRVFGGSAEGMEVWDACSRGSRKYSRKDLVEKWNNLPVEDSTITVVGMLYNFAESYVGAPNLATWLVGKMSELGLYSTTKVEW